MSVVNGKLITCDRCKNTIFCKCTGEGERDGGYTRWNKFEEAPDWSCQYEIGNLCPACTQEYNNMITDFKNELSANGFNKPEEV